ncbi:MAG: 3-phosphoserine/phosphohydroxythreonine transaminase [Gammaproteobacteria bacterium]|nr:3-phosphoserine/phosphohydroxythreonine transaminase [Gammaproteobacteria bacterium]MYD81686.1 3-phosphoserine/phosphohydroxythreonine transaminase [Gammaproteobacteria bacterium]
MSRAHNFSAGPSALPLPVLRKVQADLLNYRGTGTSVIEVSHRSPEFVDIAERAERTLREILAIGDDYWVLFMQGGATLQFAFVPLNLSRPGETVEYLYNGAWSGKAIREARRLRSVHIVGESQDSVPPPDSWIRAEFSKYLHITSNETISGVQFRKFPEQLDVPLVADMSSDILTRVIDVNQFGLIYASAQKNVGPAGLTVVIVRRDLCRPLEEGGSEYLNYRAHAERESMYNTPNTFAWYVAGLVFDWVKESGGVAEMQRRSIERSGRLYEVIDESNLYTNTIAPEFRSRTNVTFNLEDESLSADFLAQASKANIKHIRGHRLVGGFRISLYNAIECESVSHLINFMQEFERECAKK